MINKQRNLCWSMHFWAHFRFLPLVVLKEMAHILFFNVPSFIFTWILLTMPSKMVCKDRIRLHMSLKEVCCVGGHSPHKMLKHASQSGSKTWLLLRSWKLTGRLSRISQSHGFASVVVHRDTPAPHCTEKIIISSATRAIQRCEYRGVFSPGL